MKSLGVTFCDDCCEQEKCEACSWCRADICERDTHKWRGGYVLCVTCHRAFDERRSPRFKVADLEEVARASNG